VFWLGRWCNKVVVVVMVYRGATGVRLSCKCNLGCLLSARPVLVSAHLTRPASPSLKMFQLLGRRNPSSFIWGSHCTYSISANLLYFAIAALFVSSAALLQLQTRGLDRGRQFVAATPKGTSSRSARLFRKTQHYITSKLPKLLHPLSRPALLILR
jgi:hypothetical protein